MTSRADELSKGEASHPLTLAMSNAPVPELKYFGPTAIVFALISILIYILVIRPLLPTPNNNNDNNRTRGAAARLATNGGARHRLPVQPAPAVADSNNNNSQPPRKCTRSPPHLNTDTVTAVNNGVNVLVDGMVAFKYTKASAATSTNNDAEDRKARARLLANLFSDSRNNSGGSNAATMPPAKGSCVAVAIPYDPNNITLQCEQQRRALVLLASYYNLLVLVAVDDEGDDESAKGGSNFNPDTAVAQLRGSTLTQDLLPRHRIVFTSTITGRVAFVRQLQRIELVLDFDPEVKGLLSRFGHRVIVYGGSEKGADAGGASISKLGRALL